MRTVEINGKLFVAVPEYQAGSCNGCIGLDEEDCEFIAEIAQCNGNHIIVRELDITDVPHLTQGESNENS